VRPKYYVDTVFSIGLRELFPYSCLTYDVTLSIQPVPCPQYDLFTEVIIEYRRMYW